MKNLIFIETFFQIFYYVDVLSFSKEKSKLISFWYAKFSCFIDYHNNIVRDDAI